MATFQLPKTVNSTTYEKGAKQYGFAVFEVANGKSGSVLNINDDVTVRWFHDGVNYSFKAKFVGTMSIMESGQVKIFMVLDGGEEDHYVIGLNFADAPQNIVLTGPSANVTAVSFTVCFFPGTLVATPSGERKVEELVSGDLVLVGKSRTVPIKWIGRQSVSTLFGPADRLIPIRFAVGSLGGGGATPSTA